MLFFQCHYHLNKWSYWQSKSLWIILHNQSNMFVSFVWVYLTMGLTKAFAKHQYIIDSLTNPLAFAGQQMKVTPVHGFNEATTKLWIMLKLDISFVKLVKECGKDIKIHHFTFQSCALSTSPEIILQMGILHWR